MFPSRQAGHRFRSQKGLQWFFDRVAREADLPRMTSKVFRRTYQTLAHLDMMASAVAQAQAGHSDPRTTAMYHKPNLEHRKQHARRMAGVLYSVSSDEPNGEE